MSYKNTELFTIREHMGSSKMVPCKVECHVETLCSSSCLATEEFEDTKRVTRIEQEQTTQWPKDKSTKGQTTIYKNIHIRLKIE